MQDRRSASPGCHWMAPSRSRACLRSRALDGWTINAPDWLTARPIAHRGLHSKQSGLVENTPAAAAAAVAPHYAIECDIQRIKDAEAVLFHDFALDRLVRAEGVVDACRPHELGQRSYKDCDQRIVSLPD